MTGRGKPRKTKSLEESKTSQGEMKPPSLLKAPKEDFPQERVNGAAKLQKKRNPSEESPQEETTCHPRTPIAPAKVTKPKLSKEKQTQQSSDVMTKIQPEAQKDTAKASIRASKENSVKKKEKLSHQTSEDTPEMNPEAPKTTKKASIKATKAKSCNGEAKLPHQSSQETTEMKPEAPKTTKKAPTEGELKDAPVTLKSREEEEAALNPILKKTLEKLKIKMKAKVDASEVINNFIADVIKHMKEKTNTFKEVEELRTGSYYENLKISDPDEFDVMLPIPVDRVTVNPLRENGAYYSVGLKRGAGPLKKFQEKETLSASQMLDEFREEVKKCAKKHPEWELTRKKPGCPAVTLNTTVQSVVISLDVVLSLEVKSSWPSFTEEGLQIKGWLGAKVRQEYRWRPYYLVPKYEGRGNVENNGVLAKDGWRISFSHIEKDILKNHGSEKTCCEKAGVRCCRKDCLKLLKHLLGQLKEKDSSFSKFCSYHAKTTLLHACSTRTKDAEWRASDLSRCFLQLLDDFVGHLEKCYLENFFIPTQNLLSDPGKKKCNDLAARIKEERRNQFPIFK